MTALGPVIWREDDATVGLSGHEGIGRAWLRLFGEGFDPATAVASESQTDAELYWMPNGHVARVSYAGGCEIFESVV